MTDEPSSGNTERPALKDALSLASVKAAAMAMIRNNEYLKDDAKLARLEALPALEHFIDICTLHELLNASLDELKSRPLPYKTRPSLSEPAIRRCNSKRTLAEEEVGYRFNVYAQRIAGDLGDDTKDVIFGRNVRSFQAALVSQLDITEEQAQDICTAVVVAGQDGKEKCIPLREAGGGQPRGF